MENAFMLCSPSPIAPFMTHSIMANPAIPINWDALDTFGSNFVREHGQVDNMDQIDVDDEWMYILSFPLHMNMTLTDPTAVNTVDSCIKCMCHVEIVSNKIDLSAQCVKCQESNSTIK